MERCPNNIMHQETVFKYISDFLDDRRKIIYPGRDVHFELDSHYCDYDPMLRRRMTCCTYKVHQWREKGCA